MHSIVVLESGVQRALARNRLSSCALFVATLLAAGCGVDAGADASDVDVATTEQGLTASNVSLPWTGAAASGVLSTSNVGALQVVYSVSVGTTSGAISGLQVCWYAPSNADNLYRQGDQFACSIVGKTTATAWGRLTCPVNKVLSGTRVRLNAAGSKVLEFTPFCRSLTNPSEQPTELNTVIATGGEVASFFWIQDDCGDFSAVNSPAYIEHFVASDNFRGFQASCVRP